MEISESMRRAGWRECPTEEIRRAWRAKGGEWQHRSLIGMPTTDKDLIAWRPVNDKWDFDIRGWGEQPAPVKICGVCYGFGITRAVYKSAQKCSECDGMGYKESEAKNAQPAPVVPDRAGWWWRKDKKDPTRVVKTTTGFVYYTDTEDFIEDVEDDGQWLGPCVKPEAPNGKP